MLLAAKRDDAGGADTGVVADDGGEAVIGAPHLLFDRALAREVEPDAAVLFRDGEPEQPQLARHLHEIVRNRVVLFDPARARVNFLLDEAPYFFAQADDFGRELHRETHNQKVTRYSFLVPVSPIIALLRNEVPE
ncbi:hypothetical protein D3C83_25880 [compost metagenome]